MSRSKVASDSLAAILNLPESLLPEMCRVLVNNDHHAMKFNQRNWEDYLDRHA